MRRRELYEYLALTIYRETGTWDTEDEDEQSLEEKKRFLNCTPYIQPEYRDMLSINKIEQKASLSLVEGEERDKQ